ncbi:MAG: flagellar basal-body rod protein FlgG [Spirochaetales bacterium]
MVRSLYTAASGMNAQQTNIDTTSNNLSNVNTNGFKRNRADFEDLMYQTIRTAGTPATEVTLNPVGEQVGHGVKVSSTQKIFEQGSPQETGVPTDVAIQGDGFFRVLDYDGSYGYTRDGSFQIDSNGQLVTSQGYRVIPEITLPDNYIKDSLNVTQEGQVTVEVPQLDDPVEVGQLELYRFTNPAGLNAVGENMFKESPASGDAIAGIPGQEGMGRTLGGFIESSNVEAVNEMVSMITAQRAYEMNSRSIQTSDEMLSIANQLKR